MTTFSTRRQRATAARARLVEAFPLAFMPKGAEKKPLKVGIYADIRDALPDMPGKDVRLALMDYANGATYYRNLIEGVDRIGLDGQPAGVVTEHDAAYAASRIKRSERWLAGAKPKVAP